MASKNTKKKTRTRLTNAEKAAGMTIEQKKQGISINEVLEGKKPVKTQEELNAIHDENKGLGLGDVVEAVTTVTGIKAVVKAFSGGDCGCEDRKKRLNQFDFRGRKPLCLLEGEYDFMHEFFSREPVEALPTEAQTFRDIYSRVFSVNSSAIGTCSGCMRDIIKDLKNVYSTYES